MNENTSVSTSLAIDNCHDKKQKFKRSSPSLGLLHTKTILLLNDAYFVALFQFHFLNKYVFAFISFIASAIYSPDIQIT